MSAETEALQFRLMNANANLRRLAVDGADTTQAREEIEGLQREIAAAVTAEAAVAARRQADESAKIAA
jgi:hypothetical protein